MKDGLPYEHPDFARFLTGSPRTGCHADPLYLADGGEGDETTQRPSLRLVGYLVTRESFDEAVEEVRVDTSICLLQTALCEALES